MRPLPEPPPMSTRALVACLVLAGVVSVFLWQSPWLYPFRLLVTLMHESGHAITGWALGMSVTSVTISPATGGLTHYVGYATLWKQLLISSGGYMGSSVAGALLLVAAGRMRSGRLLMWGLVAWMVTVAVIWVPLLPPDPGAVHARFTGSSQGDGLFTLGFIALMGSVMALVAWKGPVWMRRGFIVWIATLSCLMALQDIKGLLGFGLETGVSDASNMARLTYLPAPFWAAVWMVMSLGAMWIGLRSILRRRERPGLRMPMGRLSPR
ncbi:M50 family metallopeptidase [Archangium primigenium]|uniref:M50 family metallopeptidase n=1 Tax=[Archangium] primigenium TaxID=2792470 RepID=UPI0019584AA7|nr:M50 family metallopeptidase [Archangium primigenium]MBM7119400.1 M50 family metallopeptidase [Archangium primigenium]